MLGLCLAPLVLVGMVHTIHVPHTKSSTDSVLLEAHTCPTGLGAHVTAAPSANLYSVGLQYGFEFPIYGRLRARVIPQVGISYDAHHYRELPLHTQFEVGGELQFAYGQVTVGYKYWHLSNAGLRDKNIGLDMGALLVGYSF